MHFGYVPRPEHSVIDAVVGSLSGHFEQQPKPDRSDLIRSGAAALRSGFRAVEGPLHVVPLSGGLDSRAVLANLLASGAKDLVAVTIGTPGTFDFEIAKQVAIRAKVPHELIDLRTVEVDERALEAALIDSDASSWALDVFFHRLVPAHFGPNATYWSGFMGGELAGAHTTLEPAATWEMAKQNFADHGAFCRGNSLARPDFLPAGQLPQDPWCHPGILPYSDQVDFGVRQESYVRHVVVVKGFDYRTPFLSEPWLRFILGAATHLRHDELLFKRILLTEFPDLYSLPTKNNAGLPLTAPRARVHTRIRLLKIAEALRTKPTLAKVAGRRSPVPFRMLNYLDFAAALRSRPDMRELVHELIRALDERGVISWLKGMQLWDLHERAGFGFDGACDLTLLASLELNLRAERARPEPLFAVGTP